MPFFTQPCYLRRDQYRGEKNKSVKKLEGNLKKGNKKKEFLGDWDVRSYGFFFSFKKWLDRANNLSFIDLWIATLLFKLLVVKSLIVKATAFQKKF